MQSTLSLITFSSVSLDRNFLTAALRSIQLTFRAIRSRRSCLGSRYDHTGRSVKEHDHDLQFEYRQFESPKKQAKSSTMKIDSKSPIGILKDVMQLTIEGHKAAANYIRKILLKYTKQLEYRQGV
ncbi:hypothetical protein HN873_040415 [Arachis hypogaea]